MNKLIEWKERLKKGHMLSIIVGLLIVVAILGWILYKKQREYRQASENSYNMAFYELVDYVQNVETYLAKSLISTTPEHGAETLTNLWREANLAQSYLSMLPVESQELENTEKFLNQVSDYSYSLSRKNIYNESKWAVGWRCSSVSVVLAQQGQSSGSYNQHKHKLGGTSLLSCNLSM